MTKDENKSNNPQSFFMQAWANLPDLQRKADLYETYALFFEAGRASVKPECCQDENQEDQEDKEMGTKEDVKQEVTIGKIEKIEKIEDNEKINEETNEKREERREERGTLSIL